MIRKFDPDDETNKNFFYIMQNSNHVDLMMDISMSGMYVDGGQALLAAWGSEEIDDFNIDNSNNGSFTLPAKSNVPAQQYDVVAGVVSPSIENYNA